MTQPPQTSRTGRRRQQQQWKATLRRQEEMLRALPAHELDALVAAAFDDPSLAAVPFSTSWEGMRRIIEHLLERGYTLHFYSFEQSHLNRMNTTPGTVRSGDSCQRAVVKVLDIRNRLPLSWLRARAGSPPHAAAIAAVLIHQIKQGIVTPAAAQPVAPTPNGGWSEARRRQKSEQMKAYWKQNRAAAGSGPKGDGRP
jgi:hypothetical protein